MNIDVKHRTLDESPSGTEYLISAVADCGCEYETAFIAYNDEALRDEWNRQIEKIKYWLQNDRHGIQLNALFIAHPPLMAAF